MKAGKIILWVLIIGTIIYLIYRYKKSQNGSNARNFVFGKGPDYISNAPKNNPNSFTQAEANASFNCDLCTTTNIDPSSPEVTYDATRGVFLLPNGREAIKCCTKRDSNCHCTAWVWKASSDCATVGCAGSGIIETPANPMIYRINNRYYQSVNVPNVTAGPTTTPSAGSSSATTATVVGK